MPALTTLTRNMRDGQITIRDGSTTPIEAIVLADNGDLKWTERENAIEIKQRGVLSHVRNGDEESSEISFTIRWTQLIQGTVDASDGYSVYEMINNIDDAFASTSGCGEKFTLEWEFQVDPPGNCVPTAGEIITFAKVFKETIECSEGNEFNTLAFKGRNFQTRPTIARVTP
jgi:hypothetical protein